MSPLILANGYMEASRIVRIARVEVVDLDPIWQKVNRIVEYLNKQSAAELAEVLK